MDRILLTGGCGLVGRTLAPLLARESELTHFDVADPGDGCACIVGDLRDAEALEEACRDKDVVVHVAALHGRAWAEAGDAAGFEVNVIGTKNVLEAARKAGVRRVVFTSSIWATGHGPQPPYLPIDEELPRQPAELYGLTKRLGEQMCAYCTANYGLSMLCLRPGGILPADAPPSARVRLLNLCVDVRDVAQAHLLAARAPEDLLHETFIVMPETPLCRADPEEFLSDPVATLGGLVPGVARLVEEGKLDVPPIQEWYTMEKARRLLGYVPRHNFDVREHE